MICGEGLLQSFAKRLFTRGQMQMEWKLHRYVRSIRIVSNKAACYAGMSLFRRQAVVRIHSVQVRWNILSLLPAYWWRWCNPELDKAYSSWQRGRGVWPTERSSWISRPREEENWRPRITLVYLGNDPGDKSENLSRVIANTKLKISEHVAITPIIQTHWHSFESVGYLIFLVESLCSEPQ